MTPGLVFTSLMGKNNTRTSASIRVFIHVKKECLISNQEAQEKGKFLSFAGGKCTKFIQRFTGTPLKYLETNNSNTT